MLYKADISFSEINILSDLEIVIRVSELSYFSESTKSLSMKFLDSDGFDINLFLELKRSLYLDYLKFYN